MSEQDFSTADLPESKTDVTELFNMLLSTLMSQYFHGDESQVV